MLLYQMPQPIPSAMAVGPNGFVRIAPAPPAVHYYVVPQQVAQPQQVEQQQKAPSLPPPPHSLPNTGSSHSLSSSSAGSSVGSLSVAASSVKPEGRRQRGPRVGHSGDRRSGRSPPRQTDWICKNCKNCNWESRRWCKRCGTKPDPSQRQQLTPLVAPTASHAPHADAFNTSGVQCYHPDSLTPSASFTSSDTAEEIDSKNNDNADDGDLSTEKLQELILSVSSGSLF